MSRLPSLLITLILLAAQFHLFKKKDKYTQPEVSVYGYLLMSDGLGRQSAELINFYLKKGIDVTFFNTRIPCFDDLSAPLLDFFKKKNHRKPGSIIIYEEALFKKPELLAQELSRSYEDDIKFAYTMFESSKIPKNFVENLNKYFDAAIVPDPYHIEVYKSSGVAIPIFVLPLGIDIKQFCLSPLKKNKNYPFIFANFSSCTYRKNQKLLIESFAKRFKNNPAVLLKIRCRSEDPGFCNELQKLITSLELKNIDFSIRCPGKEEYLKEFQEVDCYVSLSKGEGFSIQPREALALGIPCIVTCNTAQKTLCELESVRSVKSDMEEKAIIHTFDEYIGMQYNALASDVIDAFNDVYNNYENYINKGSSSRLWASNYLYENLENKYLSLIGRNLVEFGDENTITSSEIRTNSKKLYQKLLRIKFTKHQLY